MASMMLYLVRPRYSGVACSPASWASPGSLLEKQNLCTYPRPSESESAVEQDPWVICTHIKVWEALVWGLNRRCTIPANSWARMFQVGQIPKMCWLFTLGPSMAGHTWLQRHASEWGTGSKGRFTRRELGGLAAYTLEPPRQASTGYATSLSFVA